MEPLPELPALDLPAQDLVARLRAAGCVYAEEEAAILLEAAGTPPELEALLRRRVEGEPLEHIVGWADFGGLRIVVAPGVFVPRQRTGLLVRQAEAVLRGPQGAGEGGPDAVVLDLCCGSGAIGTVLAARLPGLEVHASDVDPGAVTCAAANLKPFGGTAHCGDLFAPLPPVLRGRLSVIVANAPYVPTRDIAFMPQEARLFEPDAALNGGADGLALQRRIAAEAPRWLRPGGHLLVETSPAQAAASAGILQRHGFTASSVHSDEFDGTVVAGRLHG